MSATSHLLTSDEAAAMLRMLPARAARLARRGMIPCVLLPDGDVRFDPTDLARWIDEHKQPVAEAAS